MGHLALKLSPKYSWTYIYEVAESIGTCAL